MKQKMAGIMVLTLLAGMTASAALIVDYTPSGGTTVNMTVADQQANGADTWSFRDAGDALGALAVAGNGSGGANMTIYGGIKTTWAPASAYNPLFRELSGTSLQLRIQVTGLTSSTAEGVYIWNNADYLVGAGSGAELGNESTIYWNFNSYSSSINKDLRVVVNQGGIYYVSNQSTTDSSDYTFTIDGTWQWAVLNTTDYTWGSFADVTLDDVQGVGVYFNAEMTEQSLNYATVSLDDFQVNAIPEPATLGLIALASAGILIVRRFRI